jgi:hypothetical protein
MRQAEPAVQNFRLDILNRAPQRDSLECKGEQPIMNSALHHLSADEFWLVHLFRWLSEDEQHDALVALAADVLLARLAP